MPPSDRSEIVRRLEENTRRLQAAVTFARLLSDLDEDDEDVRELAAEAQSALAESEQESQAISRFIGPRALERLREAETDCRVLLRRLSARAEDLGPAALRRTLHQHSRRPAHELVQLLGFFLEQGGRWNADRVDKVDLLLTRLGRHYDDSQARPGGEQLSQILASAYPIAHRPVGDFERSTFEHHLESITSEVEAADSLSELIDKGTLKRYRDLKHRLGPLLVHPDLVSAIIETNDSLQRKIRRLNSRVLTGIFSVYQGIFETGFKSSIDADLRREFDQLQVDFDRFEQRLKQSEVNLTELEAFWNDLSGFWDRLEKATAEAPEPEPEGRHRAAEAEELPEDWLKEDLLVLLDLLRESDRKGWPAEFVTLQPREQFQVDPREILAFRRLEDEEDADQALESFLLKAAALRRTIKRAARKLAGIDDVESLQELPDYAIARQAVRLAESYLARYSQAVEQAVLDGDVEDAQRLQILRMRLVRESAGIWLQVYQRS